MLGTYIFIIVISSSWIHEPQQLKAMISKKILDGFYVSETGTVQQTDE